MMLQHRRRAAAAATLAAMLLAPPFAADVRADVRDGVEAWSRGDYANAVSEWQAPAEAGDPDAMFNLAQAYRLGRGVPTDLAQAEALYAAAAEAGHLQAADTYGLMLFQDGRREQALPFVEGAARRGDPRARYLLGIAHFNGDLVPQDWERAYALLTLAHGEGLPQAAAAIAQMDEYIPLAQRQQGAALARQLDSEAAEARAVELARADLGTQVSDAAPPQAPVASSRVPQPIPTTAVSPSIAAARDAVEQARRATGLESPETAGASFARPAPQRVAAAAPAAPRAAPAAAPASAPAPTPARPSSAGMTGAWRVQIGAFSVRSNAERLWDRLSSRPELAGSERLLIPAGRVTKLQAGGYPSRAAAQTACDALKRSGQDCLVTRD